MKSKLITLENRVELLENENKTYVEKNEALEQKLESVVKSVRDMCEIIVKKSTDAVVDILRTG